MASCASGNTTPSRSGALTSTMAGALLPLASSASRVTVVFSSSSPSAVGHFVLVADVGEALELAGAGGGNHHMLAARQAGCELRP